MQTNPTAMYWKSLGHMRIKCELCPHLCIIENGKLGKCQARVNHGGILYTLSYGKVVSYAYDPIEKKPLAHFHPDSTIFSIGTSKCNLTCSFCQNHSLVSFDGNVRTTSPKEIVTLAKQNGSIGIAYTYNEPTIWYEYMLETCKLAKTEGLINVMVTNGYINSAPMIELLPWLDAMNIDLKGTSNSFYQDICGGTLQPVKETISLCSKSTHVEVTMLLIDSLNTNWTDFERTCKWLADLNSNLPLHISRYFPAHQLTIQKTRLETLTIAREIAQKYLKNVHIGNAFI